MINLRQNSSSGFTLIEVLLSFTILAVLLTFIFRLLDDSRYQVKKLEARQEVLRQVSLIFDRLTRELQAIDPQEQLMRAPNSQQSSGQVAPPGLFLGGSQANGAQESLSQQQLGGGGSSMTFVARDVAQSLPGRVLPAKVQITYRAVPDPDDAQSLVLIREEVQHVEPAKIPLAYKKLIRFPVAKNLKSFRLRFYRAEEEVWYTVWGANIAQVPSLIEITLGLKGISDELEFYTSTVLIDAL